MPLLWMWVEGKGEKIDRKTGKGGAAPLLVRRILEERLRQYGWKIDTIRVDNWRKLQNEAETYMTYLRNRPEVDAVLVLLDLDDGCAAEIAPRLAQSLRELNPPRPIAIVFAVREYEAWFLAAAHSLWGKSYEGDPEGKRDAKGAIAALFDPDYDPPVYQPSLSRQMNLQEAWDRSRSFRRLIHALEELLAQVETPADRVKVTPGPRPPGPT
jgi:hypothetical protein